MLLFLPCKLCIFTAHGLLITTYANLVNVWKTSGEAGKQRIQQNADPAEFYCTCSLNFTGTFCASSVYGKYIYL